MADTLTAIAFGGRDAFYKGSLARTMDSYFERIGAGPRMEDFTAHKGEWTEPLCVEYRGEVKLCELGPNTQGVAALQMLQMLERFDLRGMRFGSADSIMAQVEAKRLAFVDRALNYSDPVFEDVIEPESLVSRDYNRELSESISLTAPNSKAHQIVLDTHYKFQSEAIGKLIDGHHSRYLEMQEANKKLEDGDTTYLTVTDKDGMMVSLIQSNYRGMGSGLVADGLGFMFQDRGQLFSLDPMHPNVFEPNKRPFHTIIPAFAYKKVEEAYEPWMSFGLMGGGMQPQGHVQIILNLVDFDMGLQEAGDAARWEHRGGCEPTDDLNGDDCESDMGVIWLESGIPEATRAELERRGHEVKCCQANGGGYQAIMRDFESGAWIAATEMRKDGAADGY